MSGKALPFRPTLKLIGGCASTPGRRSRLKNICSSGKAELFRSSAGTARREIGRSLKNYFMHDEREVLQEFGKRIQRCYGCFIAYHLKDMYLGEDVTFFCEHCKDETMFHFDDFARLMDISKLKEVADEDHHH
jgi:hypothetical protein